MVGPAVAVVPAPGALVPGALDPTAMGCKEGALAGGLEASWAVAVPVVKRHNREEVNSDATLILDGSVRH